MYVRKMIMGRESGKEREGGDEAVLYNIMQLIGYGTTERIPE